MAERISGGRGMGYRHSAWAVAAGLVLAASPAFAQDINYDWVNSTVRTINHELEAAMKKQGLAPNVYRPELLEHIDSRQCFFRLQRAARKTMLWGQLRGLEPPRLPDRPKGDIT